MKTSFLLATITIILCALVPINHANAQEGSLVDGGHLYGGTGSSPFGNITVISGSTPGTSAGVYTTSVNNDDGSYTLHFIETDNAGIVISHNTETHSGENVTTGTEISKGKTLGDVVGGIDGVTNNVLGGGSDPFGCLSFYCDDLDDPFSWSSSALSFNGG